MESFKDFGLKTGEFNKLTGNVSQSDIIANTNLRIDNLVGSIKQLFTEGLVVDKGVFDLYASVKYLSSKIEELSKDPQVRSTVVAELSKFGNKYESEKYTVTMRRYGKYDFSNIGHPAIDLENYIVEVMKDFVQSAKDLSKKLAEASTIKNNVVALRKSDIVTLRDNINVAFDTFIDNFGDDQEIMNLEINPASFKGEEIPTLTPKKQK